MSTDGVKVKRSRAATHLPRLVSMAPAPCRMLLVEVFEDGGQYGISWNLVVGVICIVETEYVQGYSGGDCPWPGATHEEMLDAGWKSAHPWNWLPEVYPVVADGNADDEYPLRVWHDRATASNSKYHAVVPCTWPPEEDAEQARCIGLDLIRREGSRVNWIEVSAADISASPPNGQATG